MKVREDPIFNALGLSGVLNLRGLSFAKYATIWLKVKSVQVGIYLRTERVMPRVGLGVRQVGVVSGCVMRVVIGVQGGCVSVIRFGLAENVVMGRVSVAHVTAAGAIVEGRDAAAAGAAAAAAGSSGAAGSGAVVALGRLVVAVPE